MIPRLLLSALLTGAVWLGLLEATTLAGTERLLVFGLVAAAFGYHRHLLDDDDRIPSGSPILPTGVKMRARYTLWGIPLAAPQRIMISGRARERTERRAPVALIIELLPVPLAWLARKMVA